MFPVPKDLELLVWLKDRLYREAAPGTWNPNIDLCVKPDRVVVKVEVPGIEPHDLQVSILNNLLRIRGIKAEPPPDQGLVGYVCVERSYGRFYREIPLNWVVDVARAQAELGNGILTITFPRAEERRGKEFFISITRHGD